MGIPSSSRRTIACGYIVKPDQTVNRFFVHTHVNHYGMRSDDLPPVADPKALRVLFVGDSIVFGTTRIDQAKLFTQVVRRELPAEVHRPVEVMNASASSWAPGNEIAYVRSRGIFQSKVVLLVLNSSDLTQAPANITAVGDDLPSRKPASALAELWTRFFRPRLFPRRARVDAGDSVTADADSVVRDNLVGLDSLNAFVRAQGGRLVLIYLPFRKDIPDVSAASEALLESWSANSGCPLLDLTSTEQIYSVRDITLEGVHLNNRGNQVVADAILKAWPSLTTAK